MTLSLLIKQESKLLNKSKKYIKIINVYESEIKKLNRLWEEIKCLETREISDNPLLAIAGFVEIGPMTSTDIDKTVYNL